MSPQLHRLSHEFMVTKIEFYGFPEPSSSLPDLRYKSHFWDIEYMLMGPMVEDFQGKSNCLSLDTPNHEIRFTRWLSRNRKVKTDQHSKIEFWNWILVLCCRNMINWDGGNQPESTRALENSKWESWDLTVKTFCLNQHPNCVWDSIHSDSYRRSLQSIPGHQGVHGGWYPNRIDRQMGLKPPNLSILDFVPDTLHLLPVIVSHNI